jgi:hypothetical protein
MRLGMASVELPPIFTTCAPTEWLPAPEWMNVHYLLRAEKCPRSAALRYARYGSIWDRNGYPDKLFVAAASGTIIHSAVAHIATQLANKGCTSTADPNFCAQLKALGGYSKFINDAISDVDSSLTVNPRFQVIRESFVTSLRGQIPKFRENIQLHLSRLTWTGRESPPASRLLAHGHVKSHPRSALVPGFYFEVELRDPVLKWKGIADLLELTNSSCALTDFKSGSPSDDHEFQLHVYARLWHSDSDLNPRAIPVTKLTLSYSSEERDVPFPKAVQISLGSAIQARTQSVRDAITGPTSKAVLRDDICPNCDVRHLCNEYWTSARPAAQAHTLQTNRFDDVQLVLKSQKGESTWLADVQVATQLKLPTEALLRWSAVQSPVFQNLNACTEIRLSGALVSAVDDDYPVLTCVATTDVIVLSKNIESGRGS